MYIYIVCISVTHAKIKSTFQTLPKTRHMFPCLYYGPAEIVLFARLAYMYIRINRWTNSDLNCNELDEEMGNVQVH